LGKDAFLKEYRQFPHGLWSFDMTMGIDECKYTVSDAAAWMKELIAKSDANPAIGRVLLLPESHLKLSP
jgi:hypothetical protein